MVLLTGAVKPSAWDAFNSHIRPNGIVTTQDEFSEGFRYFQGTA